MRTRSGFFSRLGAAVVVACLGVSTPALAQHQTNTKFSGSTSGSGKIDRSIIDISQPQSINGVDGIQTHLSVSCTVGPGLTPPQVAGMFADSCNAQIGSAGFVAFLCSPVKVTLFKNSGTYGVSDNNTVPNIVMTLEGPCPGPAVSPAGLASLVVGLSALAYWQRSRRKRAETPRRQPPTQRST